MPEPAELPRDVGAALDRLGFRAPRAAGGRHVGLALTGGVSSAVWRVDTTAGAVCVKQPLPQLRVAGTWTAPVARAAREAAWLSLAHGVVGPSACQLLGYDDESHVLVMEWLDPDRHPVWKSQLLTGTVDAAAAGALGRSLAMVHGRGRELLADADELAWWLPATDLFESLRVEPYLLVTAARHPDLAGRLHAAVTVLRTERNTVIHGDVSPKNVLVGPHGPVLLDAECACPGDGAFDLAFLVNHLMLKAVHLPARCDELIAAATRFADEYVRASVAAGADGDVVARLLSRAAVLQPALALARVDGKSPVEYLDADQAGAVRFASVSLVRAPLDDIGPLLQRWHDVASAAVARSPR